MVYLPFMSFVSFLSSSSSSSLTSPPFPPPPPLSPRKAKNLHLRNLLPKNPIQDPRQQNHDPIPPTPRPHDTPTPPRQPSRPPRPPFPIAPARNNAIPRTNIRHELLLRIRKGHRRRDTKGSLLPPSRIKNPHQKLRLLNRHLRRRRQTRSHNIRRVPERKHVIPNLVRRSQ